MKKVLLVGLISMIVLVSCNKTTTPATTPTPVETPTVQAPAHTAETPEAPAPKDLYADLGPIVWGQDDMYSLRLPEAFENDNVENPDLDLSLTDESGKMTFFSVIEPKEGLKVANLSEYADTTLSSFANLDRVPLSEGTIKNSNGYTVKDIKFSGAFEGEDIIFYVRVIETDTHYIQLAVATTPEKFEANVTTMTSIIDSFMWEKK